MTVRTGAGARAFRAAALACLALGAGLRTVQYSAQTSLWLDELAVSHAIVARDVVRLVTEPLPYRQVAPSGFLALQKAAASGLANPLEGCDLVDPPADAVARRATTGSGPPMMPAALPSMRCDTRLRADLPSAELALRFVPWLSSLAALVVFWRLTLRLLPRTAGLMALVLFAASPALIVYAGQAKQYSSDTLAVVVLLWAGCELVQVRPRILAATAAACLALLVSMPAVLAGAGIGLVLLVSTARVGSPRARVLVVTGACWTAAALVTITLARLTLSADTRSYMQMFWARGFMPLPWTGMEAALWAPRVLTDALGFALFLDLGEDLAVFDAITVALALAVVPGAWWLGRRDPRLAGILVAPIAVAIIASALHLIPLEGRVSLWLGVPLLLLSAAGAAALAERTPPRMRLVPGIAAALVGALALGSTVVVDRPPYRSQDLRPVLAGVAAAAAPGDRIYVYYGARQAVRFYGPRVGLREWYEGRCHRGQTVEYFRELDAFRGRDRVWIVWSHALPRFAEPLAIRSYLSSIGTERLRIDAPSGTADEDGGQAILYDLSDPARLASTTAERHPVPPQVASERDVPCGGPANDTSIVR